MKLEEAIVLRGTPLRLNGYGVHQAPHGLYAAGLYLGDTARSADEALSMAGAKRLSLTMLQPTDAAGLADWIHAGLSGQDIRLEACDWLPGMLRLGEVLHQIERLEAGDSLLLDWLPELGTRVAIRGKVLCQAIRGEAFFHALLRIWIGPQAVDSQLRSALLHLG